MGTISPYPIVLGRDDRGKISGLAEVQNLTLSTVSVSNITVNLINGVPPVFGGGIGTGSIISATNLGGGPGYFFFASAAGGILQFNTLQNAGDGSITFVTNLGTNSVTPTINNTIVAYVTALASYETSSHAQNTYLSIANAITTYLSIANASATYLTPASGDVRFVNTSGDTMTGSLSLGGNSISSVSSISATTYINLPSATSTVYGVIKLDGNSGHFLAGDGQWLVGAGGGASYFSALLDVTGANFYGSTHAGDFLVINGTNTGITTSSLSTIASGTFLTSTVAGTLYVDVSGDTMTGSLNMGGAAITNASSVSATSIRAINVSSTDSSCINAYFTTVNGTSPIRGSILYNTGSTWAVLPGNTDAPAPGHAYVLSSDSSGNLSWILVLTS